MAEIIGRKFIKNIRVKRNLNKTQKTGAFWSKILRRNWCNNNENATWITRIKWICPSREEYGIFPMAMFLMRFLYLYYYIYFLFLFNYFIYSFYFPFFCHLFSQLLLNASALLLLVLVIFRRTMAHFKRNFVGKWLKLLEENLLKI